MGCCHGQKTQTKTFVPEQQKIHCKHVLLLGTSDCGKTTIFKQIQNIGKSENSSLFNDNDRSAALSTIHTEMVQGMIVLIHESQKFAADSKCFLDINTPSSVELPSEWNHLKQSTVSNATSVSCMDSRMHHMAFGMDTNKIQLQNFDHFCKCFVSSINILVDSVNNAIIFVDVDSKDKKKENGNCGAISSPQYIINAIANGHWNNINIDINEQKTASNDNTDDFQLGDAIALLWKLPAIKNTFIARHNKFTIPDSLAYYFNKAQNIMKPDYIATDDDVLRVCEKTTGMIHHVYKYDTNINTNNNIMNENNDENIYFVDVGGWRSERVKWINCFDKVNAIIFSAGLDEYAKMNVEKRCCKNINDSLCLFEELVAGKWFKVT